MQSFPTTLLTLHQSIRIQWQVSRNRKHQGVLEPHAERTNEGLLKLTAQNSDHGDEIYMVECDQKRLLISQELASAFQLTDFEGSKFWQLKIRSVNPFQKVQHNVVVDSLTIYQNLPIKEKDRKENGQPSRLLEGSG